MTISRFLIYFVLFNIALAAVPWICQTYYPGQNILVPNFWRLFILFSILTLVIYLVASWRMKISSKASAQAILGSITIKLLIYMIIALVYISNNTVEPVKFVLNFFYLYFFHTVFEIYCFLCNLRNQNLK